jgi:hypothetical protein
LVGGAQSPPDGCATLNLSVAAQAVLDGIVASPTFPGVSPGFPPCYFQAGMMAGDVTAKR